MSDGDTALATKADIRPLRMAQKPKLRQPSPATLEALEALVDGGVFQNRDGHFIHHTPENICFRVSGSAYASLQNNNWIDLQGITKLGCNTVVEFTNNPEAKKVALNFSSERNVARRRLLLGLIRLESTMVSSSESMSLIGKSGRCKPGTSEPA